MKFPVSRIVPKNVKEGTLWDFLNIDSVAKYQNLMGGTIKKIRKKSVSQCRKKKESLIVSKKVDPSALEWLFSHVRGFRCVENEVLSTLW